jgi:muramoyltetrapeptide carboxypeptidase
LIKPKRLPPGGTIGVVAPAGRVNLEELHRGILRLEAIGFRVRLSRQAERSFRYMAGTDAERAEALQAMWCDDGIDAIVAARGGVGTARIFPYLDLDLLCQKPKIFVGASDLTSLLLALSARECVSFHGPMVATHFATKSTPELEFAFIGTLSGATDTMRFPGVSSLRGEGSVEGRLTGGCLTLVCTSIGTPYEIETDETILFLEDIHEAPYRIDRMLSYLAALGKFDRVRGLIFGEMPGCQPAELPEIICDVLASFRFPIVFGFPSGHGVGTATLPLGISVRLDPLDGSLTPAEPAVR